MSLYVSRRGFSQDWSNYGNIITIAPSASIEQKLKKPTEQKRLPYLRIAL